MFFRLIGRDIRAECGANGEDQKIELAPEAGGHMVKVVNYMAVIKQKSSAAVEFGLDLDHGPDGRNHLTHSTPITQAAVGAGVTLRSGDSDSTKVIGEWLHPTALVGSTGATREWVVFDLYEMRKPF